MKSSLLFTYLIIYDYYRVMHLILHQEQGCCGVPKDFFETGRKLLLR